MVYRDPTGCLTAFYFSPFEVRDDSNPSGDGLSHLNRIKLGGAATPLSSSHGKEEIKGYNWTFWKYPTAPEADLPTAEAAADDS